MFYSSALRVLKFIMIGVRIVHISNLDEESSMRNTLRVRRERFSYWHLMQREGIIKFSII